MGSTYTSNSPQIVITLTSWKKRIANLGMMLWRFMKSQTVMPDIVYVWLAEEEFPRKELDLPHDLMLVCARFNIQIKWCKYNDFCFKRFLYILIMCMTL